MCNKARQAMDKGWVIHNKFIKKENEKQIRLEKFYKAKEENVSFYLKHFVKR